MDGRTSNRGSGLIAGGEKFARKPGLLARLLSPGLAKIVDRIDEALDTGAIHATLPDGTFRTLGGREAGFTCRVDLHSWNGLIRLASNGSVGWFQAWEAGEWSCDDLVALFALFNEHAIRLGDTARAKGPFRRALKLAHLFNRNTPAQAQRNISAHYDLGNDFYAAWLDPSMSYSSALNVADDGLKAAQKRKWAALEDRLDGAQAILEIGCGWGALAGHLARGGAKVTAISLSEEQLHWARENEPASIDFRKQDYRDVRGQFDGIVSVEMVEALGREYWPDFMKCIAQNLRQGGRAAIQYIAMDDALFDDYAKSADFIQAYVFPGGLLIRTSEFRKLAQAHGLSWHDQTSFGLDYAETLARWRRNFDAAERDGTLPQGFDKRFCDLWRYYLSYCEGGFRAGGIDVHQVTLVKD